MSNLVLVGNRFMRVPRPTREMIARDPVQRMALSKMRYERAVGRALVGAVLSGPRLTGYTRLALRRRVQVRMYHWARLLLRADGSPIPVDPRIPAQRVQTEREVREPVKWGTPSQESEE